MTRIVLVVAYLIGMVVAVFSMDADPGGSWGTICMVISVFLGAGTRDFRLASLSLLAIPIAIPFGLPADPGDPALPLWVGGMYFAAGSSILIVLTAFMGKFVESRLQRRRTPATPASPNSRLAPDAESPAEAGLSWEAADRIRTDDLLHGN